MSTPLFTHKIGQWTHEIHQNKVLGYNEKNGEHLFYEIQTGPYGNPVFLDEPSRRIQLPDTVKYADLEYQTIQMTEPAFVAGVICRNAHNQLVVRFSLSNPANDWTLEQEGLELKSSQGETWHLQNLLMKDKHRFVGNSYVGIYGPYETNQVRVVELEDLARFL